MRKAIYIIIILVHSILCTGAKAQNCYDQYGRIFGRVTNNTYIYDANGRLQLRFDSNRIYDNQGHLLGHIDNNTIYNKNGVVMFRKRGKYVYNSIGEMQGRIENQYVYDKQGKILGRYESKIDVFIIIILYLLEE